jgi:hypothetical protein
MLYRLIISLIFLLPSTNSFSQILTHGHSHNDYTRKKPLVHALELGFTSVEIDVHYYRNKLKVSHIRLGLIAINDIETSCGCTVPKYSKTPLQPGKTNKIFVIFDGKGKRGPQLKMLKIKTDQGDIIPITISGNVKSN